MQLSVVIVNYNVRHFLEQCLNAVYKATQNIDAEIWVVDNNSVDGSVPMVREKFPGVNLIENHENKGFSKANNQAIQLASGEFILLLNPDTVVEESTFEKCLEFMKLHPKAGGLGVKMIDGKGKFLPESKRALPTPIVAFWKIFGLSSLFPHSRVFSRYHLGYLNTDETHEVEILSGAFMFLRREALEKTGYLDETFFMYGEDIDLSWRLVQAGFNNYYFPHTTIIHYKGESTKKGSMNYVFTFYNAMIIFAHKHFSSRNARLFSILIHIAIYVRASVSLFRRFLIKIAVPLTDGLLIYSGYLFIKPYWESYHFHSSGLYPPEYLLWVVPSYVMIWLVTIYFSGGYEKPVKPFNIYKGIVIGSFTILVIYALLPTSLRFSRALILIGSLWTLLVLPIGRVLLSMTRHSHFMVDFNRKKRIVIVGGEKETARVSNLLSETGLRQETVGFVHPQETSDRSFLGTVSQLKEVVWIHKIDEVIFCSADISAMDIIRNMLSLAQERIEFKIAPEESLSVIGSNSINTAGELYVINSNLIVRESSRRNKRLMDLLVCIFLTVSSPVLIFLQNKPANFLKNIFMVAFGIRSWVGYNINATNPSGGSALQRGILTPADGKDQKSLSPEQFEKLNLIYARDYKMLNDVLLILQNIRNLDR